MLPIADFILELPEKDFRSPHTLWNLSAEIPSEKLVLINLKHHGFLKSLSPALKLISRATPAEMLLCTCATAVSGHEGGAG